MSILTFYKDHSGCSMENGMEVGGDKINTGGRDWGEEEEKEKTITMITANIHIALTRCQSIVLSILYILLIH